MQRGRGGQVSVRVMTASRYVTRLLSVADAIACDCRAPEMDTVFARRLLMRVSDAIIVGCSKPQAIRCSAWPERISLHFLASPPEWKIETPLVRCGSPTENAPADRFLGRRREGCLPVIWLISVLCVWRQISNWKASNNEHRQHHSLGYGAQPQFERSGFRRYFLEGTSLCPIRKTAALPRALLSRHGEVGHPTRDIGLM